jgi:uncharacterized membrane protein YkvA (DUF1232 family)
MAWRATMSKNQPRPEKDAIISEVVYKSRSRAEEYIRSPEKTKRLLAEALEKAGAKEKNKGPLEELWNYLTALFRLLRAYINREYKDIPWSSIVLVVVAIIYFVSIVDLIPDFLPGAGFIDDAAVVAFVITKIKSDIDKYLLWESEQKEK